MSIIERLKAIRVFITAGALFGGIALFFGNIASAATQPTVADLVFKDTKGTSDTKDDTIINMITGFEPARLAVDNKGNLYASDPVMNRLYVFNTNGRLVNQFKLNRVLAIGVDDSRGVIYAHGYKNGRRGVFILDNNDDDKDDTGSLGGSWHEPSDMAVTASGSVYVADSSLNIVRRLNSKGELKDFGPFGGEMYAGEVISGATYSRTRHRVTFPDGIAVDETGGLIYVSVMETIETLSNTACGGDNGNCYMDGGESWKDYNNGNTANGSKISTDSNYQYWYNTSDTYGIKYHVLVIDINTGTVKKKITTGQGDASYRARGLALDGKNRLYVATTSIGTAGGAVKIYDLSDSSIYNPASGASKELGSSGTTASAIYSDLAFSPNAVPDPDPAKAKGRLFATMADIRTVASYSIDGGTNPANTAPSSPTPISPSRAYLTSANPVLKVRNASDNERDPLTYGYEIRDGNGAITAADSKMAAGGSGETLMTANHSFEEDSRYTWKAQSFDGDAYSLWSGEAEFCFNDKNDNPSAPAALGPLNAASASPFSSTLSWNASTDPDCYDTLTYNIEVSGSQDFSTILASAGGIAGLSSNVSTGLRNGNTYYWRVKAVDNNGGESAFGSGSFSYKTTVVTFNSDRPDTKVYIDGNYGYPGRLLGTTPMEVQDITPGPHFVTFAKAGYEPYYAMFSVADPLLGEGTADVSASMVAASKIRPPKAGTEIARVEGGSASPYVVDFNDDGLKDVVAGGKDGRVYLYLSVTQVQDGTARTVLSANGVLQSDGSEINVSSNAAPFVLDYNNDGKKDILVGSGNGLTYIFLNTGDDASPVFTKAGTVKDGSGNDILLTADSAPSVVDYNGDGKKDLVVGGSEGTIRLYINAGTDSSPSFDSSTLISADGAEINAGSASRPFFADWNSDGRIDLLVGGKGSLLLYLNSGNSESPSFAFEKDLGDLTGGAGDASPFIVEWGGSSARDIIVGDASGGIVVYISSCGGNNPSNIPPTAPALLDPVNGSYVNSDTPVLVIANASDPEGCPLTYGYEVRDGGGAVMAGDSNIMEGPDGKTSMTANGILSENTTYYWQARSFDGDTASWSGEAEFCINKVNDAPGIPALVGPINNATASIFSTSLAWDPSRDPDCYDTVSTYVVEVSGDQGFGSVLFTKDIEAPSLKVSDIASGLLNGTVYYWRVKAVDNHGSESGYGAGSFTYKTTVVTFASDQADTKVYIDGNYGFFGRALGTAPMEVRDITPGPHFVTFVKAGYEPYHTIINVIDPVLGGEAVTVSATMAEAVKIMPPGSGSELLKVGNGPSSPFVVDYNSDGLRDMLVGGGDGRVYLYIAVEELQADGTKKVVLTSQGALLDAEGAYINVGSRAVPFAADYNNDGRKDLLVGGGDGVVYLYLNSGSEDAPLFASAITLKDGAGENIAAASNASPAVVDYNNDGKKDMVIGGSDGTLRLYINTGTDSSPEFASSSLIKADSAVLSAGSDSKAFFADWNSDGKKDIVVGRGTADAGGNTVNIFFNIGSDSEPVFVSQAGLQKWIRERQKIKGNKDFRPYLGYNREPGDMAAGSGEAAPFVVNWDGSTARDVIVGSGSGSVYMYIVE